MIIISHNKEFCGAVATEKWIMKAGLLQQEGESVEKAAKEAAGTGNKEEEEVRDAAGNIIDMKKEAKLSDKEKKKVLNIPIIRVQSDFFVARGASSSNVNSY